MTDQGSSILGSINMHTVKPPRMENLSPKLLQTAGAVAFQQIKSPHMNQDLLIAD